MRIKQIEVTNHCNLKCNYCPQPKMVRELQHMEFSVFKDCIDACLKYNRPEDIVSLHNFGEPLLHPLLPEFVLYATKKGVQVQLSTNGLLLTEEIAKELKDARLKKIVISGHSAAAVKNARSINALWDIPTVEIWNRTDNHDWAGQVSIETAKDKSLVTNCPFIKENWCVVLASGNINTCCIALEDQHTGYSIKDILDGNEYQAVPIPLCNTCRLGEFGWI